MPEEKKLKSVDSASISVWQLLDLITKKPQQRSNPDFYKFGTFPRCVDHCCLSMLPSRYGGTKCTCQLFGFGFNTNMASLLKIQDGMM